VARICGFVEREACARDFGVNGKKSGPGRWFEHECSSRNLCAVRHQESKAERCRELLILLAFLRAPRMRGQEA
jgi:hypothetical protein